MLVGELARRSGTTVRALRYYEQLGLVVPSRLPNGYRIYEPVAVRQVIEIRALVGLGLTVEQTRPFVDCLADGHLSAGECPESLAAYRTAIGRLDDQIDELAQRRRQLTDQLDEAARAAMAPASCVHMAPTSSPSRSDPDSAASCLVSVAVPDLTLPASNGSTVRLDDAAHGRVVLFVYPLTGRPGVDLPAGWETIPGAKGCTAEALGFRDRHAALLDAGVTQVLGVSTQDTAYQQELVARLQLPFVLLADTELRLSELLGLPTFTVEMMTLYRRLTLIINGGRIEHVFFPIAAPDRHPDDVLEWLHHRTSPST